MEVQGALGAGPGDGQAVQSVPGAGSPARAPAPPLPSELGLHLGRGQSHGHGSGEGDSGLQQAPEGGPAARTPCRPGRTGLGEGRGGEGASQGRGLGPGGCPGGTRTAPQNASWTDRPGLGARVASACTAAGGSPARARAEDPPPASQPPPSAQGASRPTALHPEGSASTEGDRARARGAGAGDVPGDLAGRAPRNSHCRCRVGTGYLGLAGRASGLLGRMAPEQRVRETEGWPGAGPAERERPPQLRDTMLGGAEGQGKARGRPLPRLPLPL